VSPPPIYGNRAKLLQAGICAGRGGGGVRKVDEKMCVHLSGSLLSFCTGSPASVCRLHGDESGKAGDLGLRLSQFVVKGGVALLPLLTLDEPMERVFRRLAHVAAPIIGRITTGAGAVLLGASSRGGWRQHRAAVRTAPWREGGRLRLPEHRRTGRTIRAEPGIAELTIPVHSPCRPLQVGLGVKNPTFIESTSDKSLSYFRC
jgi:hypothetical protein